MPRFSVVIPTRARPDTLAHALRTAVEQTYDDIEIIIHESGNDPRITETVARVGDPRTRLVKTGRPVSMTENWERALASTTGEYVTFIGDDDGLTSNACAAVSSILAKSSAEIVSWRPALYYWPQYVIERQRNRLQAFIRDVDLVEQRSSRTTLELFYKFREDYSRLPMIYNSFIGKTLLDRVRAQLGHYFIGAAPDVCSGIMNTLFSDTYLLSKRPLSVSGLSHHSTGHRLYFSADASMRRAAEAAAFDRISIHPKLVDSRNLKLFIGNEMLVIKEQVFPKDEPAFSYRNFLWAALQSLDCAPTDYEKSLADIREIARRTEIAIEDFVSPPQGQCLPTPAEGLRPAGNGSIMMDINSAHAGIANVRDAARLLEALLPPPGEPQLVSCNQPLRAIPAGSPVPIRVDFSEQGNGALFLGFGWGDLEPWGVWTVGRRAEVVMRLEARPLRQMGIRIEGQIFVHARSPIGRGSIILNGRRVTGFEGACEKPNVSIELRLTPEDLAGGNAIVLEFEIDRPRSPAEDGINRDTRRLGFGLKQIVIAP